MQAAPVAFGIASAIHTAVETTRAERAAVRQAMTREMSDANAASAMLRLGRELAAAHAREAALRREVEALRARATRAEGALLRLARQH